MVVVFGGCARGKVPNGNIFLQNLKQDFLEHQCDTRESGAGHFFTGTQVVSMGSGVPSLDTLPERIADFVVGNSDLERRRIDP